MSDNTEPTTADETTSDDNRYIKNDLEDYAETPTTEPEDYGRGPYLRAVLPDEANIKLYSTGGYQGTMGFVISLDGYFWLIKEMYGSCSHCDGFIDNDKVGYVKSMCRNAYCFEDEESALAYLTEAEEKGGYGWVRIASEMRDFVKEMEI